MTDSLPNLKDVYSRWEARNPHRPRMGPAGGGGGGGGGATSPVPTPVPRGGGGGKDYDHAMQSGRQMWKTKFNLMGPVPQRRTRTGYRNKGGMHALPASAVVGANLAHFKSAPTVYPASKERPFTGRCCACMPNSRDTFYNEKVREMGYQDILQVPTKGPKNGILTRTFYHYSFAMQRDCKFKYPNVSLAVLTSPRLIEACRRTVRENKGLSEEELDEDNPDVKKELKREKIRARNILNRMKAALSNRLVRFTAWFLHKLLGRLLSGIIVHSGHIEMVKEATKRGVPILFLPTHRSHLDYILITFILFNHDVMAPHVAAGSNLLIPFFGALMRGLGGFFIRRKLDRSGKKDYVYRAILHTYMKELLRQKQHFEFFVEGGRTRSGKALSPKGGLLSVVVDSYNEGVIDEALVVPISISYDKLLDGNFCREQMGSPKVSETFWRAVIAIWNVIRAHYGYVRVDFSQPFSLKEYLDAAQDFQAASIPGLPYDSSPGSSSPPTNGGSTGPVMPISASENSLCGSDISGEGQRQLIQGLAEHVVYASVSTQSLMSTQLLAFTLLHKHRQGVTFDKLVADFDWLKEEVMSRGRDLGFSGKTPDVVNHALSLLGTTITKTEVTSEKKSGSELKSAVNNSKVKTTMLTPNLSLPAVFELSYYSNVATSVFVLESALANAVYSLVEADRWLSLSDDSKLFVSKQLLLGRAEELCDMLKYEYIFTPPCISLDQGLAEAFEQFTSAEILQREEDTANFTDSRERDWARRLDATLSFNGEYESDEEEWATPDVQYLVNHRDDCSMMKLDFLRSVLAPILETYYVVTCNLSALLKADKPENDFIRSVHAQLKGRVEDGVASFPESAALDTLRNALQSFRRLRVVDCYEVAGLRMLGLSKAYREEEALNQFIDRVASYRTQLV